MKRYYISEIKEVNNFTALNKARSDVERIFNDNKFIKIVVNPPEKFKGLDYYQVTMNYKKIMISE